MTAQSTVKVRVSALRKGDRLAVTGETVAWSYRGVRTPKGQCEVRIVRADGKARDTRWNSGTMITVVR